MLVLVCARSNEGLYARDMWAIVRTNSGGCPSRGLVLWTSTNTATLLIQSVGPTLCLDVSKSGRRGSGPVGSYREEEERHVVVLEHVLGGGTGRSY